MVPRPPYLRPTVPLLRLTVPLAMASAALLLPAGAWAAPCNFGPAPGDDGVRDFAGADWTIGNDDVVLCSGQYINVNTFRLPAGRTLRIGDDSQVLVSANTMKIGGVIDGAGVGPAGGGACNFNSRGNGSSGGGPGSGNGGRSARNGTVGGGGGGGAGHGDRGGRGGNGVGGTSGGSAGDAYGSAHLLEVLTSGSGGGGGACGSSGTDRGGAGGRGGASIILVAGVLDLVGGSVDVSGGRGQNGQGGGGGGGGGGSGGGITVLAFERFTLNGALTASGGNGGDGSSPFLSERNGGGGGAGAGGRVKVFHVGACGGGIPATVGVAGGSGGNGPGNATNGQPGGAGSYHCENIQAPPVIASFTASPNPTDEGGTVTLTAAASDPNHHLLKYEFDCGNGVFNPPQLANTFACAYSDNPSNDAPFTARVRVTDWNRVAFTDGLGAVTNPAGTVAFGGSATATTSVVVHNTPPKVTLHLPDDPSPGVSLVFTVDVIDAPVDQAAGFDVAWEIGTTPPRTDSGHDLFSVTHTFDRAGDYPVDVWVTDKDGAVTHVSATLVIPNIPPVVTLGAFPAEVAQGKAATFTATAFDASQDDAAAGYEFEFDFGDGTVVVVTGGANGAPVEVLHVYETSGTFTVSVTARDASGGLSTPDSRELDVLPGPLPPTIGISATPLKLDEGSETTFAVSFAPRTPGAAVTRVDMAYGDGGSLTVTDPTSPRSFPHVYADSGRYTAHAKVVDSVGGENVATLVIEVGNLPPTAFLPAGVHGPEGTPLQVFGNATDPSTTDMETGLIFTWDWGDGSEPTSGVELRQPFHTWENSGEYTITLTVTDKDGAVSEPVTAEAVIDNVSPIVVLDAPAKAGEGETIAFQATVTDPSPADTAAGFSFVWDFGDLSPTRAGKDLSAVEYAYEQEGVYEVRLEVTDASGGTTLRTATVTVHNVAPTIDLGPPLSVARHEEVSLSARVDDPGIQDTHTYLWEFGDGDTSTEVSPKHAWGSSGVFTLALTVTDDGGASTRATLPVTVRNELPVAFAVVVKPGSPRPSDALTVTWTYSDPENDPESGTVVDWFVDGIRVPSLRDVTTVPASRTLRGQAWYAEVTPHDGLSAGETVRSNTVTIGNTPPQAHNARLVPAPPRRGDSLTLHYDFVDADGDVEGQSTIRWWRNEEPVDVLDDFRTVPGPLRRGEVWRASVTPHDGHSFGARSDALPVEVANTPPAVEPLPPIAVPSQGSVTPVSWTVTASDADADPLQYRCVSDGRVLGTNAAVSVSLPDGQYEVACTVTDGIDPVVEAFQLVIGDHGPVVHAGPDQVVDPGLVRLEATAKDVEDRPLSFEWRVVSSVHPVELSSHHDAETTFFARVAGTYELEVTVSNGEATASDTVLVTVRNLPPTADAGPSPLSAVEGVELSLDAGASSDPNGDTLSFLWQRVSGPPVEFLDPVAAPQVRLVPYGVGELVIRLTASDGDHHDRAEVSIRVGPVGPGATPPVAKAGSDVVALLGETVLLDGRGSFDVDGDVLVYQWKQISGPSVDLVDADTSVARFASSYPGLLEFRLRVNDGLYDATDHVRVQVLDSGSNRRPVARLESEIVEVRIGDEVALDGSASSDPDGDSLTFQWRHVSGPWVNLAAADEPVARLVAVTEGTSVVELRVNDGMIDSHPVFAEVVATVTGPEDPPVAAVEAPSLAFVGERVILDGTPSHDPQGRELSFDWRVVKGSVNLETPGGPTPAFVPTRNGVYAFRLVVSNGVRDSAPVDVEITVENLPALVGGCGCDGSGTGALSLVGLALLAWRRRIRIG